MVGRGSYAKGIARREEILQAALQVIAEHGYSSTTVRQIAEAVGLSQPGVLHYFGSKEKLFAEILRRRDQIDQDSYEAARSPAEFVDAVAALLRHNAAVPGLVQLYSRLANEASDPAHPAHDYFMDRYEVIRDSGRKAFDELKEMGALDPRVDTEKLSVILFALLDGLQMQWDLNPAVDMAEHVVYFLELILRQNAS